jgi:hypothetical protein
MWPLAPEVERCPLISVAVSGRRVRGFRPSLSTPRTRHRCGSRRWGPVAFEASPAFRAAALVCSACRPPPRWGSSEPIRRVPSRLNRDRRGACQAPRSRSQYRPATKFFGTWRPLSLACGPAGVARCGNSRAAFAPRAQIDPQAGAVVWRWLSSGPRHQRSHFPHRISRALFENLTSKLAVRRSHAHPVVTLGVGEQYRRHHTSCNHPLLNPIPPPARCGANSERQGAGKPRLSIS